MIRLYMSVEYQGFATMFARSTGTPASNRMLNRHRASANKEAVLVWHRHFLPGHFTAKQRKYNNQKRKEPYSKIKEELGRTGKAFVNGRVIHERVQLGGQIDNVRKGKSSQMAKGASPVKATPQSATVYMRVPFYAAMKRKDPTKPQMAKEITQVTDDEKMAMRRAWVRTFVNGLRTERNIIRKRLV